MKLSSLKATQLETPLGIMLAIANEEQLLFLDFIDEHALGQIDRKLSMTPFKCSLGSWIGEKYWMKDTPESLLQSEPCNASRLERKIKRLVLKWRLPIIHEVTDILSLLQQELVDYFRGRLRHFQTPFCLPGTAFQQHAWKVLLEVPYGETRSYAGQASAMKHAAAVRAVANANGANQLAIVIPCHRIISSDGSLGGYGAGLRRKKWLLDHEIFWLAR